MSNIPGQRGRQGPVGATGAAGAAGADGADGAAGAAGAAGANGSATPLVLATNTSGQTIGSSGTPTTITGWTEALDVDAAFDPTTGLYVAPRTGYYLFIVNLCFDEFAADQCEANVYTGATALSATFKGGGVSTGKSGYYCAPGASVVVHLTAGDIAFVSTTVSAGGGLSLTGNANRNRLSILGLV